MTQKILSYPAILVLAANTMNGPGLTTLPDVAVDAGIFLFLLLIAISVRMASFVCHRMVNAMWSSLKSDSYFVHGETAGSYERVDSVESDVMSLFDDGEGGDDKDISDATVQLTELHHHPIQYLERRGTHDKDGNRSSIAKRVQYDSLPGNDNNLSKTLSQPNLERSSIVGQSLEGYGRSTSTFVALTMVASAMCLALAQMMLCAAIMDGIFVAVSGKSCALGWPSQHDTEGTSSWIYCTTHSSMKPFINSGAPVSIMSIGCVIAAGVSVILGTKHLDEMMGVQYAFFACLLVSCARFAFVLRSLSIGLEHQIEQEAPVAESTRLSWGVGQHPFRTIGPIMFNFGFIVTAPPLSALAKREHIAADALGMSCVVMGILYSIIGWVGAPISNAVRNRRISGNDTNLLSLILLSGGNAGVSSLDLFCVGTFGISMLASVPVYCLLAQQTLVHDAGIAKRPAFLFANVLPWVLIALTYNASYFEAFVNWSGLLILGFTNFSLPLLLDARLQKVRTFRATTRFRNDLESLGLNGSKDKMTNIGHKQTSKVTAMVFSVVSASISAVIAISIMPVPSLAITSIVFLVMIVAAMWWPDTSISYAER